LPTGGVVDVPGVWVQDSDRPGHDPGHQIGSCAPVIGPLGEAGGDRQARATEDAWLVGQAQRGRPQAFEVLVHRHRDRIFRIALRITGSREDAEDVTQDVVMQLWTGLAAFSGASSFTTWLHRVVVNRSLNRRRGTRAVDRLPEPGEPAHPETPAAGKRVQDRAHLAAAARAVAALPPEQRTVFVLCQLEGLSYREVAAVHRVSEAVVRGRLARARARLTRETREWT